MLATESSRDLSSIELRIRNNACLAVGLKLFLRFRTEFHNLDITKYAPFCTIYLYLHHCSFIHALQFPHIGSMLYTYSGNGTLYTRFQFAEMLIYLFQTHCSWLYRNVGKVNVNRVTWHILMKEVNGRTTVDG